MPLTLLPPAAPAPTLLPPAPPPPPQPPESPEDIPYLELVEEVKKEDVVQAETEPRQPTGNEGPVKKPGRRRLLPLALVAVALVGVGGAVAWQWWTSRHPGEPDDLVFLPGNAQGFISLRAGDISKLPPGRKLIDQVPPFAKATVDAIHVDQVERATFVLYELEDDNRDNEVWVVLRMSKPIDKDEIFKAMGGSPKEKRYEGKTYYAPASSAGVHVWFAGEQVLVAAPMKALKKAMSLPATRAPGPLDVALGAIRDGHHLVAAVNPSADKVRQLRDDPPPLVKPYRPLLECTLVTVVGDMNEGMALDGKIAFPSEEKAGAAKSTLDQAIGATRMALAGADNPLLGGLLRPGAKPPPKLVAILDDVKTEQAGPALNVKLNLSGDTVADLMPVLTPILAWFNLDPNLRPPGTLPRSPGGPAVPPSIPGLNKSGRPRANGSS
jgi:hypothetical protein